MFHKLPGMVAGVKDAVVDAVEELYLKATSGGSTMDPRQAAQNLVSLTQGSSLGTAQASPDCLLAPDRFKHGHTHHTKINLTCQDTAWQLVTCQKLWGTWLQCMLP